MENLNNAYLIKAQHLLFKRIIAQLHLLNNYCNRLIIKNKVYALRMLDVCEYCNRENLSVIHWRSKCPSLDAEKLNFNLPELCCLSALLLATDKNICNYIVYFFLHIFDSLRNKVIDNE